MAQRGGYGGVVAADPCHEHSSAEATGLTRRSDDTVATSCPTPVGDGRSSTVAPPVSQSKSHVGTPTSEIVASQRGGTSPAAARYSGSRFSLASSYEPVGG